MKILIIDTATSVFSIAVAEGETVLGERVGDAGPATSAGIPGQIEALLTDCHLGMDDVDAFAVTVGPGAFTGLRVGIALVKGLAYSTGKPVVQLSSLELLAQNAKSSVIPVCPMFDARKSEVYSALYLFHDGMTLLRPETAISPARLVAELEGPTLFIGDGALRYRELIAGQMGEQVLFADEKLNNPKASAGAALAFNRLQSGETVSPFELLPRYLRLPEAELSKR